MDEFRQILNVFLTIYAVMYMAISVKQRLDGRITQATDSTALAILCLVMANV